MGKKKAARVDRKETVEETVEERESPKVFQDFLTAVTESNGDTRPLWETTVAVSPDAVKRWWVRANTQNQARQAVLHTVSMPVRLNTQTVMQTLIAETQRLRTESHSEDDADDAGEADHDPSTDTF